MSWSACHHRDLYLSTFSVVSILSTLPTGSVLSLRPLFFGARWPRWALTDRERRVVEGAGVPPTSALPSVFMVWWQTLVVALSSSIAGGVLISTGAYVIYLQQKRNRDHGKLSTAGAIPRPEPRGGPVASRSSACARRACGCAENRAHVRHRGLDDHSVLPTNVLCVGWWHLH